MKRLNISILFSALIGFFSQSAFAFDKSLTTRPLEWGAEPVKASCPTERSYAWVEYPQGEACIRYFASENIDHASIAIILFYGDKDRALKLSPEEIRNNTQDAQEHFANAQAQKTGFPVIVVARPGTYGSSGDHRKRRHTPEFLALNATLDLIKNRHHIKEFVLLGHSGGATAGAALLTLGRTDIRCAVLTSGAYDLLARAQLLRVNEGKPLISEQAMKEKAKDLYDPLNYVDKIPKDPHRRIYVLGNPEDQKTPFVFQRKFAMALQQAGHWVRLEEHPAMPPEFHNLRGGIGFQTATQCAQEKF